MKYTREQISRAETRILDHLNSLGTNHTYIAEEKDFALILAIVKDADLDTEID